MSSYRYLLVGVLALFSIQKVQLQQLRGCSGQEVQTMADCMTADSRAKDDMTENCYRVNLCPRDYYYQKYGHDDNDFEEVMSNIGYAEVASQLSSFNQTVVDQCFSELRSNAQQLLVACVQKDPQMASAGFQHPKIGYGENIQRESYGTLQTCNEQRLGACLAGREKHRYGICPSMKKCAESLTGKCDVALTTNVLCGCANKTFQERFDEMKANFTRCLKPPSDWTFNVTALPRQHIIKQEIRSYCMDCFPSRRDCEVDDVFSMTHCIENTKESIDQCYRSSNCPRTTDVKNEFNTNIKLEPDLTNMTSPIGSVNMSLAQTCGMALQDDLIKQIGACIKAKIPSIDMAQIISRSRDGYAQPNDNQYREQFITNQSVANQLRPLQGSCNQTILSTCLAGRKWNVDSCEIERDCGQKSANCDIPNVSMVVCTCARQAINENTIPTLLTRVATCMGLTSAPVFVDQTRSMLANDMLSHFCNCVPGFDPKGPPPAGQPPPVRRLPKNPDRAPAKPQAPATPSPVAAKFLSLLRGKSNRRRR